MTHLCVVSDAGTGTPRPTTTLPDDDGPTPNEQRTRRLAQLRHPSSLPGRPVSCRDKTDGSSARASTAFNCLEEDHYEVAHAALELAEAVDRYLSGHGGRESVLERRRLAKKLRGFREAAARVI